MFTLPTNPDTILVPIDVTETASTLEDLLRFCYPMEPPELLGFRRHRLVLEAARKYEMEFIARPLNNRLRNFLPTEAMRVYCLAYKYEDGELAQAAARQLLLQPRLFDLLHPPPEFDELPITALAKLMAYREQSATAAAAVLLDDRWMMTDFRGHALRVSKRGNIVPSEPSKPGWTWLTCQSCKAGNSSISLDSMASHWIPSPIRPRLWWETYRDSCVKEIRLFLRPLPSVVTESHLIRPALENAARCKTCEPKAAAELSEYAEAVAKRIEADVAKVRAENVGLEVLVHEG
ncbi:hypothetical protein BN946_scf184281.g16 [Trametes cinnabarina]|uniref:BTB domain-containing protein n=1 Tax=Pycnoporus cinnabarinus TaxID=5643 RepID=A0A060SXK0_PYCCI|nr:hypothetical protein BN946_scf184281.g16 [Trametes cinnabarina]